MAICFLTGVLRLVCYENKQGDGVAAPAHRISPRPFSAKAQCARAQCQTFINARCAWRVDCEELPRVTTARRVGTQGASLSRDREGTSR